MSGSSGSAGGREAAAAAESADKRRAAGGRAFAADRKHWQSAKARAVKMMAIRLTKKARGSRTMRVRATRVMTETSPREEGDNGHNNQLGAKAAVTVRRVVATTARAIRLAARVMATGAKKAAATAEMMAMMATMATMATMAVTAMMTPNGDKDSKNQATMTARVTTTVVRAMVTGAKRVTAIMVKTGMTATMATMATMTPNSDNDANCNGGNEVTK
jgi:hypothetical protein